MLFTRRYAENHCAAVWPLRHTRKVQPYTEWPNGGYDHGYNCFSKSPKKVACPRTLTLDLPHLSSISKRLNPAPSRVATQKEMAKEDSLPYSRCSWRPWGLPDAVFTDRMQENALHVSFWGHEIASSRTYVWFFAARRHNELRQEVESEEVLPAAAARQHERVYFATQRRKGS